MADEWLSREHDKLRSGLSRFLDLDAGSREVREQAGGHDDVVHGLGQVLDVEGGLADILRPGGTADPEAPVWLSEAGVAEAVRALPVDRRLAARKDPVIAASVVAELLVRALALIADLHQEAEPLQTEEGSRDAYRERYADLAREFAHARNFNLDVAPAHDLNAVLALTSVFARALLHDLGRAARSRDLAIEIARVLDEAARARKPARFHDLDRDALHLARELALDAARRLGLPLADGLVAALLDGALDDFTDADLTGVNPTDPALNGIQWSEHTRWPPGTDVEALRRRSAETAPYSRVYVLGRRPGGTSRTGAGVRV